MLCCVTLAILAATIGCSGEKTANKRNVSDANMANDTIGMYAEVFSSVAVPVSGYALVGGLNGTGSSECPQQIRTYLQKYITQHLAGAKVNVDALIDSPDTAVVLVDGLIMPAASKNEHFDVSVTALPSTQTTSLEGGWLYGADLFESRRGGTSNRALATAEGPVFTDTTGSGQQDPRAGFVLGGGTVKEDYKINLTLRLADYIAASQIRNRLNERFGYDTAVALAPGTIRSLPAPSPF